MRYWSLILTECLPDNSPLSASKRLPGGTTRSRRSAALLSWTSLRRATCATECEKPFGIVRCRGIIRAKSPLKLLIIAFVSRGDTSVQPREEALAILGEG